jgi:hypothetical protein
MGAGLRASGLNTDFWLDEIWSLQSVRQARSLIEVVTRFRSDNNHILNSLYLYALSAEADWRLFRLLALAAGAFAIWVSFRVAARWGRATGVFTAVLFAVSYPLVYYASEARGYTLAVLFGLVAFLALDRYRLQGSPRFAALFWLATALGFLSQLLFLHVYAGLAAWSLILARPPRSRRLASLALLHGVPAAFLAALGLGFVRNLEIGQGPLTDPVVIAARAAALALGLPDHGPWLIAAALLAGAVLLNELAHMRKEGDGAWVFFAVTILGSPLAFSLAVPYRFLQPRYLILPIAFFLVVLGHALGRLWSEDGIRRRWAAAALALFSAMNVWQSAVALRVGRGRYLEALTHVFRESGAPLVTVSGDQDFRNLVAFDFYLSYLPAGRSLVYVVSLYWPREGTEWYIVNRESHETPAPETMQQRGVSYRLRAEYPFRGLSGFWWAVYRRE